MSGPETSINRPLPELSIPGYTIQGVAGRGGMGTVYRAEQASPRRLVALKLLTETAASPESLAAFHREANTIARLEHPHILPVYGFGENNGRPYLVLRYLSGGSVADRLAKGPIDTKTALRWVRGVAEALDFAHERGLVHRDVKPSNILLDPTGNPYLTDFGIAGAQLAATGDRPTGSAPYMSPEQGRGEPVDHRADIYSLAVTLFEMVTGRKPYEAETPLGMIVRHINDPIPSARALNPAVPPAVDDLLRWGMAKQPGARPQTAGAFAKLLDQALTHPDVSLRPVAAAPGQSPTVVVPGAGQPPAGQSPTIVVPGAAEAPALPQPARRGPSPAVLAAMAVVGLCLVAALALGGGAAVMALLSPSATPPATVTERPAVSTPTPTPTPVGQLLVDDFEVRGSGFGELNLEDGSTIEYAEGGLRFVVVKRMDQWLSPSGRVNATNVVVEADVRHAAGPDANEMAIVCRYQPDDPNTDATDPKYVALGINSQGQYAIWRTRDGAVEYLATWTEAPGLATGPGVTHRLTAVCQAGRLLLEVDGDQVAEVTDPAPVAGDIALLAGLTAEGELEVVFDNVVVTE